MKYKIKCTKCGATCWSHGEYEPDVNATTLGDTLTEWEIDGKRCVPTCDHDDVEIIDEQEAYDDWL